MKFKGMIAGLRSLGWLGAALLLLMTAPVTARADWVAGFVPPAGPGDALTIDLPEDLDIMTLTTLGVELDGTDITSMLALSGADFIYRPVMPFAAGDHTVRLVLLADGAAAIEKASWIFIIAAASGDGAGILDDGVAASGALSAAQIGAAENRLRRGTVEIDTLTEYSNRVLDDNLRDAPNHSILSGAGNVAAQTALQNWRVQARGNYLLQTDHSLALTSNTLDLGEYALSGDYGDARYKGGVTLGHHDIGLNSNLFSGFFRRGASARLGDANDRVMAQGFAFRPAAVSGARDITGLNDSDQRLEGFTGTVKPMGAGDDALTLTGLYYDGTGADGGTGIAGADTVSEGSGWGAVAAQGFGDGRLKWRGEYARAKFDEDGNPGAAPQDTSDAWSLSAEARPFREMPVWGETPADIVLGARYDYIDTFFKSLANPGLAADREAAGAYGNLYWGALAAGAEFLHELNNVDDLVNVPSDRLRRAVVNASYSFDPQTGRLAWLGSPYVNFSGTLADLDRESTPAGFLGNGTDNQTRSATFGGGTNYQSWQWSLSHTVSDFEDRANAASDTVNHLTGFYAGWTPSDSLSLTGGAQFGVFRDEDMHDTTYDTTINLGVAAVLIPEKLDFNFDYNLNLASGSGDSPDRHVANGDLEYTLLQPRRNRPGLALAVRGSMEDSDGNADAINDETQYRVFGVLRVKAPFVFGD